MPMPQAYRQQIERRSFGRPGWRVYVGSAVFVATKDATSQLWHATCQVGGDMFKRDVYFGSRGSLTELIRALNTAHAAALQTDAIPYRFEP